MSINLINIIQTRRSIRKFLDLSVPENLIKKILQSSLFAPSAHNSQPWRFIIILDNKLKSKLAISMAKKWDKDLKRKDISVKKREKLLNESIERFTQAPVIIISAPNLEAILAAACASPLRAELTTSFAMFTFDCAGSTKGNPKFIISFIIATSVVFMSIPN